jgi:hypothetical protein
MFCRRNVLSPYVLLPIRFGPIRFVPIRFVPICFVPIRFVNVPYNMHLVCKKSRQHERYNVIAILLRYIFVLSYNASTPLRKTIASDSYRYRHIKSLSLLKVIALGSRETLSRFIYHAVIMTKAITCKTVVF